MKTILIVCILALSSAVSAHDCPALKGGTAEEALSFLNNSLADNSNTECKVVAIQKVGKTKLTAAIPTLIKYLDFKDTTEETVGRSHIKLLASLEWYPAGDSLFEIGTGSLPALMTAIMSDSTSETARANAFDAFSLIHEDQYEKVIAVFQQELDRTTDKAGRSHLQWALEKAKVNCGYTICAEKMANSK